MPPLAITVSDSGIDLTLSPGTSVRNVSRDLAALPRIRVAIPSSSRSKPGTTTYRTIYRGPPKSVRFASPLREMHVVPSVWALCETDESKMRQKQMQRHQHRHHQHHQQQQHQQQQEPSHNDVVQYFTALERREEALERKRKELAAESAALRESSFAGMWFCAAELQEIKQNCYKTIAFALQHAVGDLEETKRENNINNRVDLDTCLPLPPLPPGATEPPCVRGLEHKTPKAALRRLHLKRSSWAAVLDEQDRQWAVGVDYNDPERIAEIYRQYCGQSARRAREMGRKDALEARRVWISSRDKYAVEEEDEDEDSLYANKYASTDSHKARTIREIYHRRLL